MHVGRKQWPVGPGRASLEHRSLHALRSILKTLWSKMYGSKIHCLAIMWYAVCSHKVTCMMSDIQIVSILCTSEWLNPLMFWSVSMHTQITSYCAVCKKKHTANSFAHTYLWCTIYHPCSYTTLEDLLHRETDESAVFTNSELSLKHVDVYGFDFDYTLVHYTTEVNKLIYELARDRLVEKLNVCLQLSLFILCALC